MIESSVPKEDTTVSGANQSTVNSLGTAASRPASKPAVSIPRPLSSLNNTLKLESLKISGQGSTSAERGFKPYWNNLCAELSSMLWLPQKTDSVEQPSLSSDGCWSQPEVLLQPWKMTNKPISLIPAPCLPSLPPSALVTTENGQVVGSRKIRIYPKHEDRYFQLLALARRTYNLAIEWLKAQERVDFRLHTEVRRNIREQARKEWEGRAFASVVSDEAVNSAFDTFKSCVAKWAKGKKARLSFRSRKDPVQSFTVQRLSGSSPYPLIAGAAHVTESIPEEAIGKMATVTRRHGRWYISAKKMISVCKRENQAHTVVALDPGVRTFMTAFSPSEAIKYGNSFASNTIFPLLRKKDTALGIRQRLINAKCDEQWWYDQIRCANKRVDRLSARIDDRVSDLHKRVAFDLVSKYDTIICPPFETSQMVAKEGRKLRRSSVRQMQSLSHYAFQQRLKWMCKKYGNTFVACSEAYTSKTRSWDGVVHKNLGSATTISDGMIVVDRDHNGARGIFLLAHTRQLTPYSDPNVTVGTN